MMLTEVMTVHEVAEFLKVTDRTIYRLASEGKLPSFKVGGSWRFCRADLVKWMAEQAAAGSEESAKAKSKGE